MYHVSDVTIRKRLVTTVTETCHHWTSNDADMHSISELSERREEEVYEQELGYETFQSQYKYAAYGITSSTWLGLYHSILVYNAFSNSRYPPEVCYQGICYAIGVCVQDCWHWDSRLDVQVFHQLFRPGHSWHCFNSTIPRATRTSINQEMLQLRY